MHISGSVSNSNLTKLKSLCIYLIDRDAVFYSIIAIIPKDQVDFRLGVAKYVADEINQKGSINQS